MPRIRPLDPADSEGSNREIFEQLLKDRGRIPNFMRTIGHRPELLRTMVAHLGTAMRQGAVPPLVKELLAVRVSRLNGSEYALSSHTQLAKGLGASAAQIEALMDLSGWGEASVTGFPADCLGTAPTEPPPLAGSHAASLFSDAERAAVRFADRMTTGSGRVDDAAFLELRNHYAPAEIVEIATVVGLFNYVSRFANALEIEVTP
jgi:AhpD family alkylhydroperoxidase